jgi:crotonobetainyl-CoA:carnitine CoA-transferase CaiB-like acyl-CoA transferase
MDAAASLARLLAEANLPAILGSAVAFGGEDPVLPIRYKVAAAAQAAIAASGLAAAQIHQLRTGERQELEIDAGAAVASMRSYRYFRIDGETPPDNADPLTGFYRTAERRWLYLHCNFFNLKARNLAVLRCVDDRAAVAQAVLQRGGESLEEEIVAGGGCGAFVRSEDEWMQLPPRACVAREPLVDIQRIGDAPAMPLPSAERPLAGVRSIDMTRVLAGPTASKVLASHGAQVLRIDREDLADSGYFDYDTGLGKRAAFLDLRRESDRATMDSLLDTCDVFVQAYRPGALAARGLSAEQLAARRPGIVTVNLSAWGFSGPWQMRRGYDTVVQAANGLAWSAGDDQPTFLPVAAQDYLAGYLMAFGAMVALGRRATQGGSWRVNVSLAGVGEWLRSHGAIEPRRYAKAAPEVDADLLQRIVERSPSAVGELSHLKAMPAMSRTPPHWSLSPSPRGHHPAAWTDNVDSTKET